MTNDGTWNVTGARSLTISGLEGSGLLSTSDNLTLDQSGNSTYEGQLDGVGSFIKEGAGILTLSGDNPYVGVELVINEGGIALDGSNILDSELHVTVNKDGDTFGTISLVSGEQSIASIAGAGNIFMNDGTTFNVEDGGEFSGSINGKGAVKMGGEFVFSGDTSIEDQFVVTTGAKSTVSEGTELTVSSMLVQGQKDIVGTTNASNITVEDTGELHLGNADGSVAGTVNSESTNIAGMLSGAGILSGSTTISGTLAPGNSPGQVTFDDLVLTGLSDMEIDGTAGAGVAGGYDQVVITAGHTLTIGDTATMQLGVDQDGTSTFEPAKGDVIQIFKFDEGAVTGDFASISSSFANDVVFNIATGSVVGVEDYDAFISTVATNANQQAMLDDLMVEDFGGVAQYYGGKLVEALATNADTDRVFTLSSPETYTGFIDQMNRGFIGNLTNFTDYSRMKNDGIQVSYVNTSGETNVTAGYADYNVGENSMRIDYSKSFEYGRVVASASMDKGSLNSSTVDADSDGYTLGLGLLKEITSIPGLSATARIAKKSSNFDATRTTLSSSSMISDVDADLSAYGLGLVYQTNVNEFGLTASIEAMHYSSEVNGFTETNSEELERLTVGEQKENGHLVQANIGLTGQFNSKTTWDAGIGYTSISNEMGDVTANVASETQTFAVQNPGISENLFNAKGKVSYQINQTSGISLEAVTSGNSYSNFTMSYKKSW